MTVCFPKRASVVAYKSSVLEYIKFLTCLNVFSIYLLYITGSNQQIFFSFLFFYFYNLISHCSGKKNI